MISVCMATYNGERYIKQQIDSILCQLSDDDELIISDDESSDQTVNMINSYKDSRITLLQHQKNHDLKKNKHVRNFYFAAVNFENAIKHAKGDYIFLADQDDVWLENRVNVFKNMLRSYDIVMCNFNLIDCGNNILYTTYYKKSPISKNLLVNICKSRFIGCCMAFNKKIFSVILPFPNTLFAHDYWIGCLGSFFFNFTFILEPFHAYRIHENNVSPGTRKSSNSLAYKIVYRLKFFLLIIFRIIKLNFKKKS